VVPASNKNRAKLRIASGLQKTLKAGESTE
jgi:hypothetical protein